MTMPAIIHHANNATTLLQLQQQRVEISFLSAENSTVCKIYPKANDIIFIKADGSYSNIVYTNGYRLPSKFKKSQYYYVAKVLKHFDEMLSPIGFVRIHNSYLVNICYIDLYDEAGFVYLSEYSHALEVSPRKRGLLKNALKQISVNEKNVLPH